MADKKFRKSLDNLRGDIQELAESFAEFRDHFSTQQAIAAAERQKRGAKESPEVRATTEAPAAKTTAAGDAGYISTFGVFEVGSGTGNEDHYRWSMEQAPIQNVLETPVDHYTQKLAAIGHTQRLGILLTLLGSPSTALEVVETLSLGTTGAAYHHLNVLQSARIVEQLRRGTFSVIPDQIPVILTILSALSNQITIDVTTSTDGQSANPVNSDQDKSEQKRS